MVTAAQAPWQDAHFVGGHPVLDLTNTVFNRKYPVEDGDLFKTPSDVLTWCASVGLVDKAQMEADLVQEVRAVREQAWAVFDAVARGEAVPTEPLGALLSRAGAGVGALGVTPDRVTTDGTAIPALLSLLAVQALFTLPADRVRACGRCGWLFLDSSRGGRRRWCSMSTCGNREKASRHRQAVG